jgi:nitrate reductase NapAB chaperone NapD
VVISGTALFIQPGSSASVIARLHDFPAVTFHVQSEAGTELVVTVEAHDFNALERICDDLKQGIPQIVDIAHVYVNFEDEVEKIQSGMEPSSSVSKRDFDP